MTAPEVPSETGLTRRAVGAGVSIGVLTGIENALIVVRTLILARLLSPKEFGLMGMAFIAINATEALTQTGFAAALVQRRDDPEPYLDTAFSVGAVRGFLVGGLTFLVSPFLGSFFRTPEATPVLEAVAFVFVLRGFMNPAWFLLERDLKLTRLTLPRTIGTAVDLLVTTALAFPLRSVWAMVWGYLAGSVVNLIATYAVRPWVPHIRFSLEKFNELRAFGRHVFRNEVLTWVIQQGDKAVVGRLRDAVQLGYYSFAYRMATLPATTLGNIGLRVVFPAFARIQAEPGRVRDAYQRLMVLVNVLNLPVAAGLLLTASEIVPAVFGEKWIPITATFRILSLLGITTAFDLTCGAVGSSQGRPDLVARASLIRIGAMAILIVPMTHAMGIEGAALAMTAASVLASALLVAQVTKLVGAVSWAFARRLGVPVLACLAMAAAILAVRWAVAPPAAVLLAILAVTGGAVYAGAVVLLDRAANAGVVESLKGVIRPR